MTKRRIADLIFMAFLLAVSIYVVVSSQGWPAGARLFPTGVGVLMGVLVVAQAVTTMVRARREKHAADKPIWPDVEPSVAARRAATTAASIIGMALLIYLLGFPIGGPVALAIHLFLVVREKWLVSTALVVASVAMLWAASVLLNIPFPEPVVPGLSNPF